MGSFIARASLFSICSLLIAGCASQKKITKDKDVVVKNKFEADLSKWTLREKIGQLLIVGYRDPAQIAELKPGAVALFSWSMKSVEQTRQLTQELRELAHQKLKAPLLIATDHEGGKVIRLRNGMTLFPEASAVGTSNDLDLAKRVGFAVGQELAYLGINANFAPVLDLGGADSFLGNRLWGENPEQVARMTGAYIQGLQGAGVMSVAKHFPGHGPSGQDAHFSVPINHKKLSLLMGEDLYPFHQAVLENVPAIMTAHVRVPEVDRLPASMSSRFLSRILRDTFKFDGVIVTDDLEMKGAQESLMTAGDLALQALVAGSDMLLVVWSKVDQKVIVARIEKAIQTGEWSEVELDKKLRRILALKSEWIGNSRWGENHFLDTSPMRSAAHMRLIDEVESKPTHWIGPQSAAIKARLSKNWSRMWRVALPKGAFEAYWKKLRPQDEVFVHEKRLNTSSLSVLRSKFSPTECANMMCLVLTDTATQTSEGFYSQVRDLVESTSTEVRVPAGAGSSGRDGAIVWAHMGLEPTLEGIHSNSALVVLGSSSLARVKQLSIEIEKN